MRLQKTNDVMATINSRAEELGKLLGDGLLPPLPSDQRAAILEGKQEATAEIEANIDDSNQALVLLGKPKEVREKANELLVSFATYALKDVARY